MSKPAEVFPVAHFLKGEMEARAWTVDDLLNRMPGDRSHNQLWLDLIFAEPEFDIETQKNMRLGDASALAHAFGVSSEFWTALDNAYHEYVNRTP